MVSDESRWKKRKSDRWSDFFFDFDRIEEMMDNMMSDFFEDNEIRFKKRPMVIGFSIKQGPSGKIMVEEFGDLKAKDGKPIVSDKREPLVDITESEKEITITAELPGVNEKDIKIETKDEKTVVISVDSNEMPYYKEIKLSDEINPKKKKINFKNGILEVSFEKKKLGFLKKLKSKKAKN